MKETITYMTLLMLVCAVAISACRKEDASPVYNYIGGSQATEATEGEDADLTAEAEEEAGVIPYSSMDLSQCDASGFTFVGSGFVFNQADFETLWNEWCDQPTTFAAFDEVLIAYYSAKISGCGEIKLKDIRQQGDNIVIDVEQAVPDASCTCTKNDKIWRMMLAVQKIEGATPTFNETTVEASCE
jgi:hypothetical protein